MVILHELTLPTAFKLHLGVGMGWSENGPGGEGDNSINHLLIYICKANLMS